MKDKNGIVLEEGDDVDVEPGKDNLAQHDFTGYIKKIHTDPHGNEIALVIDQEENGFECESHELIKV